MLERLSSSPVIGVASHDVDHARCRYFTAMDESIVVEPMSNADDERPFENDPLPFQQSQHSTSDADSSLCESDQEFYCSICKQLPRKIDVLKGVTCSTPCGHHFHWHCWKLYEFKQLIGHKLPQCPKCDAPVVNGCRRTSTQRLALDDMTLDELIHAAYVEADKTVVLTILSALWANLSNTPGDGMEEIASHSIKEDAAAVVCFCLEEKGGAKDVATIRVAFDILNLLWGCNALQLSRTFHVIRQALLFFVIHADFEEDKIRAINLFKDACSTRTNPLGSMDVEKQRLLLDHGLPFAVKCVESSPTASARVHALKLMSLVLQALDGQGVLERGLERVLPLLPCLMVRIKSGRDLAEERASLDVYKQLMRHPRGPDGIMQDGRVCPYRTTIVNTQRSVNLRLEFDSPSQPNDPF